jgi:glycosyltransferase involved in cell wall biosynthesis
MTGIPLVCIGKELAEKIPGVEPFPFYEVADIINNGENGFIADDIRTLRSYCYQLLNDDDLAKSISQKGRETSINLFAKEPIKKQWQEFLNNL